MRNSKVAVKAEPALGMHLRYAFEPGEQRGATLGNPLFDLLTAVLQLGSIRHAAQSMGRSYRYVWGSLRKWEHLLGEPLIVWSQGQRARPTQFAQRLLWAERRARTRMQPHIEALRSDLSRVVTEARDERHQLLTVQASHDMALSVLQQHVADTADLHLDIRFQGSEDALRGLSDRQCLVAGFHVPVLRGAAPVFAKALKPLLKPGRHKLIGCSRRMQGLMVRREHAALIRTFPDVARHRLRFVNRQIGSGTRMLIDHLMREHSMNPSDLPGFHGLSEETHVAVALCVASGIADAGVGVEAAALEFGLHFAPLVEENYFLACLKGNLGYPAVLRLCAALAGAGWRDILANLPGYRPALAPGKVLIMTEALPWWPKIKSKPKPPKVRTAFIAGIPPNR
ncbi:MAG TPA: substrate-binding domain-containing protein [Steroidobacteraceae bacterium]|jgi:putative molybdopterin biosynthesis protein|nr:substrate-binding domain-containing protein [Steroidobacteraceae bacterium]